MLILINDQDWSRILFLHPPYLKLAKLVFMNLKFNITSSRMNCFTAAQAAKVDAGVEIFKQIICSEAFLNKVNNFQWRTTDGVAFNRFYLSNGMSNKQVSEMICQGLHRKNDLINMVKPTPVEVVNIVPCSNQKEIENIYNNTITCCIGADTNMLNNTWYTPVHLACAIMHEWCCWNGFNCSPTSTKMENWSGNTVPVACAWITKDVAAAVCNSSEVSNWCGMINNRTFDYCACSTTYLTSISDTVCISPIVKMDECINLMELEMNWLTTCKNVSPDVSNRMTVLNNCIRMMTQMKLNMCNTTMDGSDWACVPVNTMSSVNFN